MDKTEQSFFTNPLVYAIRIIDQKVLSESSSGGGFTAISDIFLDNGDAILCTVYNYESHVAEFRLIVEKDTRNTARGSKYMQSKPGDSFSVAAVWLKNNPTKRLLFIGMGCQAEGFRKFTENLGLRERVYIVDIICHGTPSPKLWKEYSMWLERKYGGQLSELSFKDKRNGWKKPTAKVCVGGKEVLLCDYVKVFYKSCALRPSCHICPFTTMNRKSDITIGDFWHIEESMPEFYNEDGNSLFLIHTKKGKMLFDAAKKYFYFMESNPSCCWQPNLAMPTPVSEDRERFWADYRKQGVEFVMKKYGKDSLRIRIKRKIRNLFGGGYLNNDILLIYTDIECTLCGFSERRAA